MMLLYIVLYISVGKYKNIIIFKYL